MRSFVTRVRKHPWITGAISLVVAGAIAAAVLVVLPSGYGEQVTGPSGTFPAALTSSGRTPSVLTTFTGPVSITDGLALVTGGNTVPRVSGPAVTIADDEVAAVSLRTGTLYWSYARPGHSPEVVSAGGPDTGYVLWNDGLLTRVDLRTATVQWHAMVAADVLAFPSTALRPTAAGQPVLVIGLRGIEAVNAATGAREWTATAPPKCDFNFGLPAIAGPVVALRLLGGPQACSGYVGYSIATGRIEWRSARTTLLEDPVLLAAGNDQILASGSAGDEVVLNAADGRAERRMDTRDGAQIYSAADGQAYQTTGVPGRRLVVWNLNTGREAWQARMPAGLGIDGYAAGDRGDQAVTRLGNQVYVTATSSGPRIPDGLNDGKTVTALDLWLLSYDATTGRLLSRTRLPSVVPAGEAHVESLASQFRASADPVITSTVPASTGPGGLLTVEVIASGSGDDEPALIMTTGTGPGSGNG